MVRLHIHFRDASGLAFEFDAGTFTRNDAPKVAQLIQRETEAAALDGEDVEFVDYRLEAVGGAA